MPEHGFLRAVAGVIGGYSRGAFTSLMVLQTLSGYFYAQRRKNCALAEVQAAMEQAAMKTAFEQERPALESNLRRDPQLAGAGTTIAGLVVLGNGQALPFHLGDCQLLRWSAGLTRFLKSALP